MPHPPSPASISDLLVGLQDSFSWPTRSDGYELIDRWERERSGSVFYRMTGRPYGQAFIVKIVKSWEPGEAERNFQAMDELAETVESAAIEEGRAIRPLAWADQPPLLVMPYVEAADLVSILRQPDHPAWNSSVATWMEIAGRMLAAYHAAHLPPPLADISNAGEEARILAIRYRLDEAFVDRILNEADWRHRCARSFGDFGPGNLLGTSEGALYLIDPPDVSPTALIHRDLGNFIFELRRQLAGRGFTRSRPVIGRFDQLRSAFIGGYSSVRHDQPLNVSDEALISLFELRRAAGMARKRFPNRPGDAVWFARSAMARRREIRGGVQS